MAAARAVAEVNAQVWEEFGEPIEKGWPQTQVGEMRPCISSVKGSIELWIFLRDERSTLRNS